MNAKNGEVFRKILYQNAFSPQPERSSQISNFSMKIPLCIQKIAGNISGKLQVFRQRVSENRPKFVSCPLRSSITFRRQIPSAERRKLRMQVVKIVGHFETPPKTNPASEDRNLRIEKGRSMKVQFLVNLFGKS